MRARSAVAMYIDSQAFSCAAFLTFFTNSAFSQSAALSTREVCTATLNSLARSFLTAYSRSSRRQILNFLRVCPMCTHGSSDTVFARSQILPPPGPCLSSCITGLSTCCFCTQPEIHGVQGIPEQGWTFLGRTGDWYFLLLPFLTSVLWHYSCVSHQSGVSPK